MLNAVEFAMYLILVMVLSLPFHHFTKSQSLQ